MVVSPIMLIRIYINDITAGIESQIRLFADDCIMYRTINSFQDHIILQHDFKTLTEWVNTWQMEFNVSKCKYQMFATRVLTSIKCMILL